MALCVCVWCHLVRLCVNEHSFVYSAHCDYLQYTEHTVLDVACLWNHHTGRVSVSPDTWPGSCLERCTELSSVSLRASLCCSLPGRIPPTPVTEAELRQRTTGFIPNENPQSGQAARYLCADLQWPVSQQFVLLMRISTKYTKHAVPARWLWRLWGCYALAHNTFCVNRQWCYLLLVTTQAHLIEQCEAHSGGVLIICNHYSAETVVPDVHVTQVFCGRDNSLFIYLPHHHHHNGRSFILGGTFGSYKMSRANIWILFIK